MENKMPDDDNQGRRQKERLDSAEGQQEYLLENRISVLAKLKQLAKLNSMVTATFDNGNNSMNTSIIEVLKDMDLVALDYGPTESLNARLLAADRILFKADVEGVDCQFKASSITKAKLHGEPVFAIPIPESILWVQRREFFRVRIPLGVPVFCEVKQVDGSYRKYKVLDISSGGISLHDEYKDLNLEAGIVLSACTLELPEHGHGQVNLEVRNILPYRQGDRDAGKKIGCSFVNLGMSFAATIQRYINAVEAARRRLEE
ncbi:MAG: flagellar brake protein [Thioalkalispiraceae bacterium]|jgi:c-di-GMP-binding flagellar brake protein YcgR